MNPDFEPISVAPARAPDFSVGSLTIRPSLRQVETGGEFETPWPCVMQVLVALFQRRNELVQRCWGGRVVGEDAISRAITLLTGAAIAVARAPKSVCGEMKAAQ